MHYTITIFFTQHICLSYNLIMGKEKKILIIRLGALGDVVMTTIIASAIKQKHPDYKIHYLTQIEIAPILENHPHIDKVITWNTKNRKSIKQLLETGKNLFNERYDIVFNLTNAIRNILLSLMCCSKKIVNRKYTKGSWIDDFFQTAKSVIKDIEQPERLYLGINKDSQKKIENFLKDYQKPHIAIIAGGATDRNRQGRIWNIQNWKKLIEKLQNLYGGTIFVCGGKSEKKYHEQLATNNVIICSGNFNISESNAMFKEMDLMLSGDTGPVHIASAHNIKTLTLLGSTSPNKIKPYGKNGYYISSDDDCKYCWKKKCKFLKEGEKYTPCMEHITVNMVLNKIKENNLL